MSYPVNNVSTLQMKNHLPSLLHHYILGILSSHYIYVNCANISLLKE